MDLDACCRDGNAFHQRTLEIDADGLMKQSISVALLPSLITSDLRQDETQSLRCAIVIDVLRATSVMTTAGRNGAASLQTCGEVDLARELADGTAPHLRPLLCGERACVPIKGFDLGNSPAEYPSSVVANRHVLLTTTNGTKAIAAVQHAKRLLIASFLNLTATVNSVADEQDLLIVCAGTEGQISYEDVLLAGAIVDGLMQRDTSNKVDDSARMAWASWQQACATGKPLAESLGLSLGGRNLLRVGYAEDLQRCAVIDSANGIVERDPKNRSEGVVTFGWKDA
ncbi:hypothetical protein CGZ80_06435 [Rhodopirellula sp. MGV]|nr:hypothetical protein CGZ80_06435 [Rhodopirellula sp. MGV]PNY36247.1 2-phosphosulfolactate phosphatase [Rhodopirellula baltica]